MSINAIYQKKNKKGGYRVVYSSQSTELDSTFKILNLNLSSIVKFDDSVHGFIKGRNIKTNASAHLNKKYLLSVDIENFFESITTKMIIGGLIDVGFKKHIAILIAQLTTLNNTLVQGFSTSPVLANIVFRNIDTSFKVLSGSDVSYTRYADDLYFSSNNELPLLADIYNILNKNKFRVNEDKTKYMKRGRKQYVTGLTVFDDIKPRVSKRIKKI